MNKIVKISGPALLSAFEKGFLWERQSFCLVSLFVLVAARSFPGYTDAVMADGPEAYYRFEESAGVTDLVDSAGNGLALPLNGDALDWKPEAPADKAFYSVPGPAETIDSAIIASPNRFTRFCGVLT